MVPHSARTAGIPQSTGGLLSEERWQSEEQQHSCSELTRAPLALRQGGAEAAAAGGSVHLPPLPGTPWADAPDEAAAALAARAGGAGGAGDGAAEVGGGACAGGGSPLLRRRRTGPPPSSR